MEEPSAGSDLFPAGSNSGPKVEFSGPTVLPSLLQQLQQRHVSGTSADPRQHNVAAGPAAPGHVRRLADYPETSSAEAELQG